MPPKFHTEDPKDLSRSTCGCVFPRVNGVAKQADAGAGFGNIARPRRDWSAVLEWAEREAARSRAAEPFAASAPPQGR